MNTKLQLVVLMLYFTICYLYTHSALSLSSLCSLIMAWTQPKLVVVYS